MEQTVWHIRHDFCCQKQIHRFRNILQSRFVSGDQRVNLILCLQNVTSCWRCHGGMVKPSCCWWLCFFCLCQEQCLLFIIVYHGLTDWKLVFLRVTNLSDILSYSAIMTRWSIKASSRHWLQVHLISSERPGFASGVLRAAGPQILLDFLVRSESNAHLENRMCEGFVISTVEFVCMR